MHSDDTGVNGKVVFKKNSIIPQKVGRRKSRYRKTPISKEHFGINDGKLCITPLSRPITSPEQKTFSEVALSQRAFPLALSAEIEFSRLHSSGRLTMFVPSTILIQFCQIKDPVANNDSVEKSFEGERVAEMHTVGLLKGLKGKRTHKETCFNRTGLNYCRGSATRTGSKLVYTGNLSAVDCAWLDLEESLSIDVDTCMLRYRLKVCVIRIWISDFIQWATFLPR